MGDSTSNQPIGIILTVVGVVILDFCADALDGPVRAYLLDVADTEEQDMALNIHTFSAGTLSDVRWIVTQFEFFVLSAVEPKNVIYSP